MNKISEELLSGFGYDWMKVYDETRKRFGTSLTLLAAKKLKES